MLPAEALDHAVPSQRRPSLGPDHSFATNPVPGRVDSGRERGVAGCGLDEGVAVARLGEAVALVVEPRARP